MRHSGQGERQIIEKINGNYIFIKTNIYPSNGATLASQLHFYKCYFTLAPVYNVTMNILTFLVSKWNKFDYFWSRLTIHIAQETL